MNEKEKLKVLSLFAGIGGIDLGLESTGRFETIQFVEYEPFCQHILRRHWPDAPIWGDVKTFDPDSCGDIDLICGGYPCQPFSVAGKQKGTEDDRHLWPRMFEIIKHKRPTWVLCENVPGHVNLGLDQVLFDLESEGYSWQTFVLGAVAVDAPHRRQRLFIVANTNNTGHDRTPECETDGVRQEIDEGWQGQSQSESSGQSSISRGDMADAKELSGDEHVDESNKQCDEEQQQGIQAQLRGESGYGAHFQKKQWEFEPAVGRVAHGIPDRVDRLKALGNAIVPQIIYHIGKAIADEEMDNTT